MGLFVFVNACSMSSRPRSTFFIWWVAVDSKIGIDGHGREKISEKYLGDLEVEFHILTKICLSLLKRPPAKKYPFSHDTVCMPRHRIMDAFRLTTCQQKNSNDDGFVVKRISGTTVAHQHQHQTNCSQFIHPTVKAKKKDGKGACVIRKRK